MQPLFKLIRKGKIRPIVSKMWVLEKIVHAEIAESSLYDILINFFI